MLALGRGLPLGPGGLVVFTLYKSQGPIQSKSKPIRTTNLAGYLIILLSRPPDLRG